MYERRIKWQGMNWITQIRRLAIYIRDDFTCAHCGRNLRNLAAGERIELDHILPVSNGGTNATENLVTCCGGKGGCNVRRSDTLVEIYHADNFAALARIGDFISRPINPRLAKQILEERKATRE